MQNITLKNTDLTPSSASGGGCAEKSSAKAISDGRKRCIRSGSVGAGPFEAQFDTICPYWLLRLPLLEGGIRFYVGEPQPEWFKYYSSVFDTVESEHSFLGRRIF